MAMLTLDQLVSAWMVVNVFADYRRMEVQHKTGPLKRNVIHYL
jgi:hypothetical protein